MVQVRESKIVIPTYLQGKPNVNPIIVEYRRQKVYPYVMRDNLLDVREEVEYKALELENEYVKAIVIPELGGRLYSALDKRSGKEIFYRNNVVKPQLVALSGAWSPGGIEWNFPIGHRPSGMELIDSAFKQNSDGSASIFIGEIDKMTGMKFTIEVVLRPKTACVEEITRLYNPTEICRMYYFWNTSAMEETKEMEYRYPFKWIITNEFDGRRSAWPYSMKTDLRKNKDIKPFTAVFGSNVKEDFFGTYDIETDRGLIYTANYQEMPGKKLWSWGNKEQGRIWNKILTDNDGPYVEVQSGNVETQNEFRKFQPNKSQVFKQYWFQAYRTGSYTYADKNGIITVKVEEKEKDINISFFFSMVRHLENALIQVKNSEKILYEKNCALTPENAKVFDITVDRMDFVKGKLEVNIICDESVVMRYRIKETKPISEQIKAEIEDHDQYNKSHMENDELEKAVKLIKNMKYADAEKMLTVMHQRKEFSESVTYYLGLTKYKLKKYSEAEGLLFYLGTFSRYYGSACSLIGRIKMLDGNFEKAEEFFANAYESNPSDYVNVVYYAYSLRKRKKLEQAEIILRKCIDEDPLNLSVYFELSFINGHSLEKNLEIYNYSPRVCVEDVLELIKLYHQVGDYETALAGCDLFKEENSLLLYHKAYYKSIIGDKESSKSILRVAEEMSLDYIFPNKEITLEVFIKLLEIYESAKVKYLLGLIYASNEDYEKAVILWDETANKLKYSVVNRNLGYFYWKYLNKPENAYDVLEKGQSFLPVNADIFFYADQIYKELGLNEKRRVLLSKIEALNSENQIIILTMLGLYNEFGMYDRSLELIQKYKFSNWENEAELNTRTFYTNARIGKGLQEMEAGNIHEAIEHLSKVYEYPSNTGLGDSFWLNKIKVNFYLMLCFEAIGVLNECLNYCRKIVQEYENNKNDLDNYKYYVKAINKMVELEWIGLF